MGNAQLRRTLEKEKVTEIITEAPQQEQEIQNMVSPLEEALLTEHEESRQELNIQQNAELTGQIRRQVPPAQANGTAQGVPVQEESPASMTFKERQQERRKARAARRASPAGSAASYDMVAALRTRDAEKSNSAAPHKELVKKSGVDGRVLRSFSRGYQEKGIINRRPATEQDRINKEADDRFYEDYCSKDVRRRKPHLERIVNEMINIRFTPQMLTERYLRANMRQIAEISHKMMCLNNVMSDSVNAPFFEKLDPYRKEALERSFQIFVPFEAALLATLQKQGVDFNLRNGGFIAEENKEFIEDGEERADSAVQSFQETIGEYERTMADLKAEQKHRVRISASSFAAQMDAQEALLERMKPGLGLEEWEETGRMFRQSHTLFRLNEPDEQNLATAKTLLEIDRLRGEKPSEDLYNRARALALPRVERIMACDVDDLAFLTDEALMVRNAEINELFMDSMALNDLMEIKHPLVTEGGANGTAPTLRDELVEYRSDEFFYKISMLRGLQERARVLAIDRALEEKDTSWADLLTRQERAALDEKQLGDWTWLHLNESEGMLKAARENRARVMAPGTREFQMTFYQNAVKIKASNKLRDAGNPLLQELADLWSGKTMEAERIRKRLNEENYYSLKYDKKELAAKIEAKEIKNENIEEPLFRSYLSFMGTEAAQKLLTPETAREMILNLGAGAGMYREGEWKEPALDEKGQIKRNKHGKAVWAKAPQMDEAEKEERLAKAQEKNERGIAVHREVMRAQFDMLTRRYGNRMEEMTLEEIMLHQAEIARDFQENQLAYHMEDNYPDYLDLTRPEDLLLKKRIEYYNFIGVAMTSAMNFVFEPHVMYESGQQMQDELRKVLKESFDRSSQEIKEAYEWLTANDRAFVHGREWSQGVRVPGENEG
ncbi:MAG: hypothetical protein LUH58_09665 [Lachnospiraceae bacterium]|nr:hypothetical protein [Lachnospiraceae bacterium]